MTANSSFSFYCEPVKVGIHTEYVCVFACLSFLVLFAVLFILFTEKFSSSLVPSQNAYVQCHVTSELQLPSSSLHFLCFVRYNLCVCDVCSV